MSDPFQDADAFMNSGSSIAAKFPQVGFVFEGDIIGWDGPQQMTDKDTGEALYWESNKKTKESDVKNMSIARPAMQLLIHVQGPATGITWETNQYIEKEVPDDDGVRTLYVHGELQKALKKARLEAGNAKMEVGAHVKITRGKPVKKPNGYFAYTYAAEWTPAAKNPSAAEAAFDAAGDPEGDEPPF